MEQTGGAVRRMQGALRVGLAWQVLWGATWASFASAMEMARPGGIDEGEGWALVKILGLIGLVSGGAFAALLALVEKGRTVEEVSMVRAAAWGVCGAAIVPLAAGKYDQMVPMGVAGIIVAVAMVAAGRKGARGCSSGGAGPRGGLFAWVGESMQEATNAGGAGSAL